MVAKRRLNKSNSISIVDVILAINQGNATGSGIFIVNNIVHRMANIKNGKLTKIPPSSTAYICLQVLDAKSCYDFLPTENFLKNFQLNERLLSYPMFFSINVRALI